MITIVWMEESSIACREPSHLGILEERDFGCDFDLYSCPSVVLFFPFVLFLTHMYSKLEWKGGWHIGMLAEAEFECRTG
jgi:hypothetical protein